MLTPYNDTSGGSGSGSGNSPGGGLMMNVTEIFALLKRLTPEQREELQRKLQQTMEPREILDLLQGNSKVCLLYSVILSSVLLVTSF